ncbi:MAG: hypothetical protein Q7S19_02165 [bacterium]|nr:hypothetical protein [bacterium]
MGEKLQNFGQQKTEVTEVSDDALKAEKFSKIEEGLQQELRSARMEAGEETRRSVDLMIERLKLALNEDELRSFRPFFRDAEVLKTAFTPSP